MNNAKHTFSQVFNSENWNQSHGSITDAYFTGINEAKKVEKPSLRIWNL